MRRICVFCGSSHGSNAEYTSAARRLGALLAERGSTLVYGGGNIGLMGEVADAVLEGGGEVIGVIPHAFEQRELAHQHATTMHVVDTMHERKAMMSDLADGFIAMPGGFGTLEEILEVITWAQLGIHQKPCAFLNVADYFSPLISFLDHAIAAQFVKPEYRRMIMVQHDPDVLLRRMGDYQPPDVIKWITRDER